MQEKELLDGFENILHCKKHLRLLKYVFNNNYYCADCPERKVVHPLLTMICDLLPIDLYIFKIEANRNSVLSDDIYDFASNEFRNMDELLRCPVSKRLYDKPTLTSCFHNYDSCSKELVLQQGKCPICFIQLNEMELETDAMIESLSKFWVEHRHDFLALECNYFELKELLKPNKPSMNGIKISGVRKLNLLQENREKLRLLSKTTKDSEVRRRLEEFEIPTHGSKDDRIQRMNQFLKKFNHNLGINRPISPRNLLRQFINEQNILIENRSFRHDDNVSDETFNDIKSHQSAVQAQLHEILKNQGRQKLL